MTNFNSTAKRMFALFLSVLMMFTGMAISANADGAATPSDPTPVVPTSINAPTLVQKSDAEETATFRLPTVEGFEVKIESTPAASYIDRNDGTWTFINLTHGQLYSFKAYITKPDGSKLYSSAVTVTLKDKFAAPDAPVATKITSTSITAATVTACEYKLVRNSDQRVIKDWSTTVVFEGLTPSTLYTLSIRKAETSTKYASDPVSITIKTLRAGDSAAVKAPVLVDKTNTTIIVKAHPDNATSRLEFSIDRGATWQYSGEFKNLTPNTIYGIVARKAFDPAEQDPNPISTILEVRTNSKARVEASLTDCTFTVTNSKVYANELINVVVTGDGPEDNYLAEFGDTRYIPYSVLHNGETILVNGKGSFDPGVENKNSTITVTVVFNVEKFNGGTDWVPAGTVQAKYDIEVGPEKTIFTVLGEFFATIITFFADTIPSLILSTGPLWEKAIALFLGMFGDLGLTK